jgi:hypothetical protein
VDLAAPIKGAAAWRMVNLSLEQLIGGAAVAFGVGHMLLDPRDFLFEGLDPSDQLVDRQRPEVLLDQLGQRILWLVRKKLVQIHRR